MVIMLPLFAFDLFFTFAAFVLGAIVGSFLNVCVYRMPLGLSVNQPRRSFCPNCKAQIAWYENLPIVSWPRVARTLRPLPPAHRRAVSARGTAHGGRCSS